MREIRWLADPLNGRKRQAMSRFIERQNPKGLSRRRIFAFISGPASRVIVGLALSERRLAPAPQARRRRAATEREGGFSPAIPR